LRIAYLLLLCVLCTFGQPNEIPAQGYNGLEVITTKFYAFARTFSYDPVTKYLYLLATNNSYHQNMYLVDTDPFIAYTGIISLDADFSSYFTGTVNISGVGDQFFSIGTRNRGESEFSTQALSIVIVHDQKEKVFEIPGFNLWNLHVDIIPSTNTSSIYAFFAGYIPIQVGNDTGVQFAVIRMKVTLGANISIAFDPINDIVTLRTTGYQAFSPDFKPWIFRDKVANSLFVVVPGNDAAIFSIQVMPDPLIPLQLSGYQAVTSPIDAAYDNLNGMLYLAYSGTPGWIDFYNILQRFLITNFKLEN